MRRHTPAPRTGAARDLGSHESRDRDLLAPEAKRPPTAVVSYVSVRSRSRRYPQSRELSSSARGGPSGAKARARKFPHFPARTTQKVWSTVSSHGHGSIARLRRFEYVVWRLPLTLQAATSVAGFGSLPWGVSPDGKRRDPQGVEPEIPRTAGARAPLGATPLNLRMQAQTAARYEDILAHVTLTGAGSRDSRLLQYGTRPEYGTRGISHPRNGRAPAGAPPTSRPPLAVREDGGVVWSSDGAPFAHPVSCLL
jgi:hypothetical protein